MILLVRSWWSRRPWAPTLLLAAAILAACGEQVPPLPRLGGDAVVLAFGDSLTYGTGAAPDESYPAALARLIGRSVVSSGVPGELSGDALARLPAALDEHRPALLLLCSGGNDLLRRVDESRIEANLRAMIELARSRGVAVVLIGVPRPRLIEKLIDGHDKAKPMFLYFASLAPHAPYQAPKADIDAYQDVFPDDLHRTYAGMITNLDRQVGRIYYTNNEIINTLGIYIPVRGITRTPLSNISEMPTVVAMILSPKR